MAHNDTNESLLIRREMRAGAGEDTRYWNTFTVAIEMNWNSFIIGACLTMEYCLNIKNIIYIQYLITKMSKKTWENYLFHVRLKKTYIFE